MYFRIRYLKEIFITLNNIKAYNISVVTIVCIALFFTTCRIDEAQPATDLLFSTDTIYMDTMLTQLGSPTTKFLVYNRQKKKIKIKNISLAAGVNSEYIININGMGTGAKTDVEINPSDSIFIFIQAKLKKNNVDSLVKHNDNLIFSLENKTLSIPVISWGRDATCLSAYKIGTATWNAGTTVLIKDSAIIDEGQTLTIEEGANVLFKPGANLIVRGTLLVQGSIEKPVTFEGYRLQYEYRQLPGQWGSIIFENGSKNNRIKNATIRNGANGLQLKKSTIAIDLELENVIVDYMSYAGILCKTARLNAVNCVIANCGSYAISLTEGGDYSFTHITVSNFSNEGKVRTTPSVYINNYSSNNSEKIPVDLKNARFENSIIVGYIDDETKTDKYSDALFNVAFLNCIIKQVSINEYMNPACILYDSNKKLLIDSQKDFALDTLSEAQNKADAGLSAKVPSDIKGRSRLVDGKPDIGAYEYFYDTTKVKK